MSTTNFNLRGLPTAVMSRLKKVATKKKTSVNLLIIYLIQKSVGYSHAVKQHTYHELDELAGVWSKAEAEEFNKNIRAFEEIDSELWT